MPAFPPQFFGRARGWSPSLRIDRLDGSVPPFGSLVRSHPALDCDWDALRRAEFPVAERWAYFDHAAVAPLTRRAGDTLRAWADDVERHGVIHWPAWEAKLGTIRRQVAALI